MDPFVEVLQDAQTQQKSLSLLLSSNLTEDTAEDFKNGLQELRETLQDLKESIESSKADPEFFKISEETIHEREGIVDGLEEEYGKLERQWTQKKTSTTTTPFTRFEDQQEMEQFTQVQQQEMLREQDGHLDGVYASMQNIHAQARMMGTELEEQAFIVEELEGDMDRITGRVGRGLKRVEHVIRTNSESASNCCIGLLIVALIVLLVLVVVV